MPISKLRIKLLEMGVKQYMLAAACEIAPSRISEYVLLQKPIAAHHLPRICGALGCQPEEIIGKAPEDDMLSVGIIDA